MKKVVNLMDKKRTLTPEEKTLQLCFFKQDLEKFKDGYLGAEPNFFKGMLRKCITSDDIFNVYLIMAQQKVIPLLCSAAECLRCLGMEVVDNKAYSISVSLEKEPIVLPESNEFKDADMVYTKVTEDEMFRFKRAFLAHNAAETIESLENAKDEVDILNILYDLMTCGTIPILWPLVSDFDSMIDVPIHVYLIKE